MRFTHHINGWEAFTVVAQDAPGLVDTTGSGLYTDNLSNCMCLILTDGINKYGMLHVNPRHANVALWVTSLRKEVGATTAIVAGANAPDQTTARQNDLATLLAGLTVIDETRTGWVPAVLNPVRGSYRLFVGYAAVNASNGEYALSMMPFAASVAPPPPTQRARRNSGDGCCLIM